MRTTIFAAAAAASLVSSATAIGQFTVVNQCPEELDFTEVQKDDRKPLGRFGKEESYVDDYKEGNQRINFSVGKDPKKSTAGLTYRIKDDKVEFDLYNFEDSNIESLKVVTDGESSEECRARLLTSGGKSGKKSVCSKDTSIKVTLCEEIPSEGAGESAQPSGQ